MKNSGRIPYEQQPVSSFNIYSRRERTSGPNELLNSSRSSTNSVREQKVTTTLLCRKLNKLLVSKGHWFLREGFEGVALAAKERAKRGHSMTMSSSFTLSNSNSRSKINPRAMGASHSQAMGRKVNIGEEESISFYKTESFELEEQGRVRPFSKRVRPQNIERSRHQNSMESSFSSSFDRSSEKSEVRSSNQRLKEGLSSLVNLARVKSKQYKVAAMNCLSSCAEYRHHFKLVCGSLDDWLRLRLSSEAFSAISTKVTYMVRKGSVTFRFFGLLGSAFAGSQRRRVGQAFGRMRDGLVQWRMRSQQLHLRLGRALQIIEYKEYRSKKEGLSAVVRLVERFSKAELPLSILTDLLSRKSRYFKIVGFSNIQNIVKIKQFIIQYFIQNQSSFLFKGTDLRLTAFQAIRAAGPLRKRFSDVKQKALSFEHKFAGWKSKTLQHALFRLHKARQLSKRAFKIFEVLNKSRTAQVEGWLKFVLSKLRQRCLGQQKITKGFGLLLKTVLKNKLLKGFTKFVAYTYFAQCLDKLGGINKITYSARRKVLGDAIADIFDTGKRNTNVSLLAAVVNKFGERLRLDFTMQAIINRGRLIKNTAELATLLVNTFDRSNISFALQKISNRADLVYGLSLLSDKSAQKQQLYYRQVWQRMVILLAKERSRQQLLKGLVLVLCNSQRKAGPTLVRTAFKQLSWRLNLLRGTRLFMARLEILANSNQQFALLKLNAREKVIGEALPKYQFQNQGTGFFIFKAGITRRQADFFFQISEGSELSSIVETNHISLQKLVQPGKTIFQQKVVQRVVTVQAPPVQKVVQRVVTVHAPPIQKIVERIVKVHAPPIQKVVQRLVHVQAPPIQKKVERLVPVQVQPLTLIRETPSYERLPAKQDYVRILPLCNNTTNPQFAQPKQALKVLRVKEILGKAEPKPLASYVARQTQCQNSFEEEGGSRHCTCCGQPRTESVRGIRCVDSSYTTNRQEAHSISFRMTQTAGMGFKDDSFSSLLGEVNQDLRESKVLGVKRTKKEQRRGEISLLSSMSRLQLE